MAKAAHLNRVLTHPPVREILNDASSPHQTSPTQEPTMSKSDDPAAAGKTSLPLKPIPGSYGIPFLTPIKDRYSYFYCQGEEAFFATRAAAYGSTVFRTNMPPGPFMASDPRVVAVLDARSFPCLFDKDLVDKTDVLTGTYVPSLSLTGGHRMLSYLDPSEPRHPQLKRLVLNLLASRKSHFIPSFLSSYSFLLDSLELELPSASFNSHNQETAFEFVCTALLGAPPPADAVSGILKWLVLQLHPLATLGLWKVLAPLEDLLLHCFPLPPFLARSDYRSLYRFFSEAGAAFLDEAEKAGVPREEACHNLLFVAVFNAYGGIKVFFPTLMNYVAAAGAELHGKLREEIRAAVAGSGGEVTAAALERMELTKSVVWEALRVDPPVKYQYGKARKDFVVESHEAAFEVKEGEMVFGYQPMATRDEKVFARGGEFVADRFVGEEGRKLLKYVVWSNGPETGTAEVGNKQCAGKEVVVLLARLLMVAVFLRWDSFTAEAKAAALETGVTITSVTKRAAAGDGNRGG